jgi:hypothetical protein
MRNLSFASLVVAFLFLGFLLGRVSVQYEKTAARPAPVYIEPGLTTAAKEHAFIRSLGFTFVHKAVAKLKDGEAGWATPWSIDGTTRKAFIAKSYILEKGYGGTLHLLIGKRDGRLRAILYKQLKPCGGDDKDSPSGEAPLEPSVLVKFSRKLGPCY